MKKLSVMTLLMLVAVTANALQPADPARIDEIIERGSNVMPFDLNKTLHIFNKTASGGLQQVIAKDSSDDGQIILIRKHLAGIAAQFAKGDFSGPQRIHGMDMPGVNELSAGAAQLRFSYQDLPDGGQIEYVTDEPKLIDAVHRYFDAQLSDHARHAVTGGHGRHAGHRP